MLHIIKNSMNEEYRMVSMAMTAPGMGICSGTASVAERASGIARRSDSDGKEGPGHREKTVVLTSPPSRPP
jgi:hypothetical protein